jgi:diguanylate cyclase (GGDEF)-like protein/putative nucleotidyltransferase with HDIG domain
MTTPVADWSEIRFRADTVRAGVRLAAFTVAAGVAYAGVTWDQPRRSLLLGLFGGMLVVALLLTRLPIDRVVRARRREWFFVAWSVVSIALAGAAVAADGGGSTPLVLLFFPPLVFAALSYPLWSVVLLSAFTEVAFVGTSAMGSVDPAPVAFSAAALAMTAVLCAWQAQTHEHRRRELEEMSRADPLTGCLNRRGFEEQLRAELDEGSRTGQPLTVLTLDLDDFKRVNDTRGHAAGDELLCWTVGQLEEIMRSTDSIGRMGGDEFALLMRGASSVEGTEVAERIRNALSERISTAIGRASFPSDGIDEPELLRHADAALYAAKQGRRPEGATSQRDLSWAAVMARAVDLRTGDEHSQEVARLAGGVAQELGWNEQDVMLLRIAAMLHDLGKVSISDRILRKPTTLSQEEYDQVKRHAEVGSELVARVEGLEPIVPWLRHANERYDGSGYPDGLVGDAIPQAARILLSADAFVAMTSHRPYRRRVDPDDAMSEMRRCAGTQFDPACVAALERIVASETLATQATPLLSN